jgi:hypothetical protein
MKQRLEKFYGCQTEPSALCINCEYYDGGGLRQSGVPFSLHGDCLNSRSPRFQTTADQTCKEFFPCSTRWPDSDHD